MPQKYKKYLMEDMLSKKSVSLGTQPPYCVPDGTPKTEKLSFYLYVIPNGINIYNSLITHF